MVGMTQGFNIVREFDNGQILRIAWRANLEQAEELVQNFYEHWPGNYGIEEATEGPNLGPQKG